MTTAILKGLTLGLFMAISVGPTIFAIIRYSLTRSYKAGIAFVLGVSLSDIMYVVLANVAVAQMNMLSRYAAPINYAGGTVLILLGLKGILSKQLPKRPSQLSQGSTSGDYFRIFGGGFLINTFNPGVIVTWLALVTGTLEDTVLQRAVTFAVCLLMILGIDFLKVFLADVLRRSLTYRRMFYLQKVSAICLFAIGIWIVVSQVLGIGLATK